MNIGLTGGICCGKSTLGKELEKRDWHIIDTDEIAHRLMRPGELVWKNVVDAFGRNILSSSQSIDRKVLGKIVYADPAARAKLNEITHPPIRAVWQHEREERVRCYPSQSVAVMIPLLFECKLEGLFDVIWTIGASRTTQVGRIMSRGFSEEESLMRMRSQISVGEKMSRSHVAFWNEGTQEQLKRQLDYVLH